MINFQEEITNLKNQNQFRSIPEIEHKSGRYIFSEGQKYLNLSSNDYLGLAYDEDLVPEFLEFVKTAQNPLFSSASARLLTGNHTALTELEGYVARLFNKERCLLFNSGYHANIGVVSALCEKGCAVFSDKLNHASIIDGMKLADGDFYRYRHLDYEHLEELLAKKAQEYSKVFIISESVFSMDGDACDIQKLVEIKNKYNAVLIIDEAHAFGVFGEKGCGLSEDIVGVDLVVATFGKALASYGAFVVGDEYLIEYLCNKARSFIFSTAIPPINAMWTLWLLENKTPFLGEKRSDLITLADKFRQELRKYDIKTLGESQIVPVIIGENEKTVQAASQLRSLGYWVLPIRPPTVPKGGARLRFSLNTLMTEDEILPLAGLISEILE
ncbi:MAG: 8-amino-7-oxononanoate synthase [Candidatus Gastranaerophilales bacterium]|nr:8-amino-7-oxononanoate synthase [Candidatus Gastranaerophilales bacterium]